MGVELGKVLAKNILAQLGSPSDVKNHDSSVSTLNERVTPQLTACADYRVDSLLPKTPCMSLNSRNEAESLHFY